MEEGRTTVIKTERLKLTGSPRFGKASRAAVHARPRGVGGASSKRDRPGALSPCALLELVLKQSGAAPSLWDLALGGLGEAPVHFIPAGETTGCPRRAARGAPRAGPLRRRGSRRRSRSGRSDLGGPGSGR